MVESQIDLLAGGRSHAGWQSVQVRLGMDQCAGGFRLMVSERWIGQDLDWAIPAGERCELLIGGETVITGWVDETRLSMDAGSHQVELSGRDATGDLVDCSAVRKAGQWRGLRIEQIATELAAPFGVAVRADVDTGKPLPSFALQEGETAFEAIERAARIRALLLVSDGRGGLLITRAGTQRVPTPLVLGENILQARVGLDMRDRFSSYIVKGQAPGNDFFSGPSASQIKALASDTGVKRYRPLIITNDAPDLAATLTQRAEWEANVRAARSLDVELTVQGWRHAGGLWRPNTLVSVIATALRLDADLLVTNVLYSLDDQGTTTALRLTRPDAYTALPLKAAAVGSAGFWTLPAKDGR
ncbi:phage baseplate assembly protein [Pseudaquabacterium pictum]|uniref:Tail protein n=1 Tax=Pseudaquabacterium pictum TaxID=2315236 RepID=A0A480ARN1_9BURK|nr:contractile injection system protein, VgrG/Pvc8 family [Rubrivivax pictus]GCL64309.1 tail protein [Rubrivivax pictus]